MYSTRSQRNAQARRYNKPGQFVNANEQTMMSNLPSHEIWHSDQMEPNVDSNTDSQSETPAMDMTMSHDLVSDSNNSAETAKRWLKKGVKISMREKRRRQNNTLRRLITPKNALMVLNELAASSRQECTVSEIESCGQSQMHQQYLAVLNMGGVSYSGTGSTKLMAKNQAAENIIKDLIIKQMNQVTNNSPDTSNGESNAPEEDQSFPMIQLASYALHKLFSEWQIEGYKVHPFGKPTDGTPSNASSTSTAATPVKAKKIPTLPPNPETLHPCSLLCQMRGVLEYFTISHEGTPPNGQIFTMGVAVDGKTFQGSASNKKEARKLAAIQACKDLFGISYPDEPDGSSVSEYM